MTPEQMLERSLRLSVQGHQIIHLEWEPAENPGEPDKRIVKSARPATSVEFKMWDRLLILERLVNGYERDINELRAEIDRLRRPASYHAGEPKRV